MSSSPTVPLAPLEPQITPRPIDPGVRIGHAHLKVADLDRALEFYCGVLGFELMQRYGREAAFLAAGGYHHHLGLNVWASSPEPQGPDDARLLEWEVLVPTVEDARAAVESIAAAGYEVDYREFDGAHTLPPELARAAIEQLMGG